MNGIDLYLPPLLDSRDNGQISQRRCRGIKKCQAFIYSTLSHGKESHWFSPDVPRPANACGPAALRLPPQETSIYILIDMLTESRLVQVAQTVKAISKFLSNRCMSASLHDVGAMFANVH